MKILLLSAYDANSHRYWHQSLVENLTEHQWTVLTLEPRFFSWRVRGNSLSWAFNERHLLTQQYDLLVATSMVDLNGLRGFIPSLAAIPSILYFHENQFAYPVSSTKEKQQHADNVEAKIVSLYAALCTDKIVFNSEFNRDTFLAGTRDLLKRLPDQIPANLLEIVSDKSSVLPVPIKNSAFYSGHKKIKPKLQIVWNHRWEYDKGPEHLLACIKAMPKDLVCEFHVVGQKFRNSPETFAELKEVLNENNWLGTWGYVENSARYQELLTNADVVLSTALHDFQGLAVLEAVAAGCIPVVPDRLAYPELFPVEFRYLSAPNNIQKEAESAATMIVNLATHCSTRDKDTLIDHLEAPDISKLSWESLAEEYRKIIFAAIKSFNNKSKK